MEAAVRQVIEQAAVADPAQRLAQFGGQAPHDLLAIGEKEGGAAHNAEHAQGGDERRYADPRHQYAIDQARYQCHQQAGKYAGQHCEGDFIAAFGQVAHDASGGDG